MNASPSVADALAAIKIGMLDGVISIAAATSTSTSSNQLGDILFSRINYL
jgi:hypothetical protein